MNNALPHFLDYLDRKWLIDTGSLKNYINPDVIKNKDVTRYKEKFVIKTPNGESEGDEYISMNLDNIFPGAKPIKLYLFKFSDRYDVLLGHESLSELKATINFNKDELECNFGNKKLLYFIKDEQIILKPGENICKIPVRSISNGIGILKPLNKTNYEIKEGLVKVKNAECFCIINNNTPTVMAISPEPMETEEVEFEKINKKQKLIIKDKIEELVRTEHMNIEEKQKILSLIKQYPEIIKLENEPLSSTNLLKHKIVTKDELPVYSRNYRYPEIFRKDISNEIDKLLENKIIQPSNSPYNSPIWVVPKKLDASGKRKVRMVIDYRKLNEKTIEDKFPLPNIEDLFGKIGRATYFSTIDLASGFHQIEMDKDSIPKTAFSTDSGHYEFLRMPFGLKNGPPCFQRAMNIVFSKMNNVLVYMDDLIIFSDNLEEHLKHLKSVFEKLKEHNLKIQIDKTEFFKKELLYLGHIISEKGVRPNPTKIEVIKNFLIPKTQKQIKQFLGLTGYYRKMIHNYAKISKPLTLALTKDYQINVRDPEYVAAFENLKSMLCNSPILQLPDFNKIFFVTTDASQYAIGAVLSQNFDGNDLPITFASRTLNKHEENLSVIEKELLAIVYACKYFRPYLYGRKFIIQTDHKPLQWLQSIKEPNSKLLRWRLLLEEFDYDIRYVKGKTNTVADALSRIEHPVNAIDNHRDIDPVAVLDEFLRDYGNDNYSITAEPPTDIDLSEDFFSDDSHEVINENQDNNTDDLETVHSQDSSEDRIFIAEHDQLINTEQNQILLNISHQQTRLEKVFGKQRLHFNVPKNYSFDNLDKVIQEFLKPKTKYGLICQSKVKLLSSKYEKLLNDFVSIIRTNYQDIHLVIYKKLNLDICDKNEQTDIIQTYHLGKTCHRGITETYNHIRREYYWPSMKPDITSYINSCDVCLKVKYDRKPIRIEYKISPTPDIPFERLQIDVFSFQEKKFLTIVDCFSKLLNVYPLQSLNQIEVQDKLLEYLMIHPTPKVVQMDNGREFDNEGVRSFLSSLKIQPYYITPGHPDSHGLIERVHSTLVEILNALQLENKNRSLLVTMKYAVLAYNNSLHSKLKMTPFEITFGLHPTSILFTDFQDFILEDKVDTYHQELGKLRDFVKNKIVTEKESRTTKLNATREKVIELPPTAYQKNLHHRKDRPRYSKILLTKEKTMGKFPNRKRSFKIHPNRLKRPRIKTNQKHNSVSDGDNNTSPRPSTSRTID